MVLYIKEFTKKYNYVTHINRKFTCNTIIDKDLLITQLQNEIKIAEELNIIKDNNIILKKEIKILEEEKNIILKQKQQLLNNKDIEINKLYKNRLLKDKDGDIKIKTVQGYVYIIRVF
jgi:hypothetical protein